MGRGSGWGVTGPLQRYEEDIKNVLNYCTHQKDQHEHGGLKDLFVLYKPITMLINVNINAQILVVLPTYPEQDIVYKLKSHSPAALVLENEDHGFTKCSQKKPCEVAAIVNNRL